MKRQSLLLSGWLLLVTPAAVQAQFNYTVTNGKVTITEYTGTNGDVVAIPETINGLPVTSIGDSAFAGSSITSVTMPNSVTNIGANAFNGCTNLTSVTIPNGVTSIGVSQFKGYTFANCPGLTSVTIPNSVTSIGDDAFYRCSSLTNINVETNNLAYTSVSGVLFNHSKTTLIEYPGGKVGSYSIPNSATSIGDYAFDGCTNLTSVTMPSGITNIGFGAFSNCGLTNVVIASGVTSIGNGAFFQDRGLTSLIIPNSVTTIGPSAFNGCTSLTNVTIGNNVTVIGDTAFGGCTNLTRIYFQGNAPTNANSSVFWANGLDPVTVYYLPGMTGWSNMLPGPGPSWRNLTAGLPTAIWQPQIQTSDTSFGVKGNQFGFNVIWASGMSVVVEATTDLANTVWSPVATNGLSSGTFYFSDAQWTNYPRRFYRVRSP